jgi:hypothetical protein
MTQPLLVLNTLVLQSEHNQGKSQLELVKQLLATDCHAIELRREFGDGSLAELEALNALRLQHQLVYFYSVPENLFINQQLNPQLLQIIGEAEHLGASYIKMTLGDYVSGQEFDSQQLTSILPASIHLNLENDQTQENTEPEKLKDFFDRFDTTKIKVGFVNDLGNWIFVNRDAEMATKTLLPYTRFVHLKSYVLDAKGRPTTVPFDQGELDWRAALQKFDSSLPVALEYPTTLTALQDDLRTLGGN